MMLIESEFCVASGAKLNFAKTRILSSLEGAEVEGAAGLIILQGDEFTKSLGAIYSVSIQPDARFEMVLEKMLSRMMRWQAQFKSLMARVLIANALLSSCLWFFAFFIIPTPDQVRRFDAIIWGMVWGKESGSLNSKGSVARDRVCSPKCMGGLNVIRPSSIIEALCTHGQPGSQGTRGMVEWFFGMTPFQSRSFL